MSFRNLAFRTASIASFAALLLSSLPSSAAPRIIQERAKVQIPGPTDQVITRIAFSGNTLLVGARRNFNDAGDFKSQQFVYWFERSSSTAPWAFVRTLFDTGPEPHQFAEFVSVAMQGNIAAIGGTPTLHVYERSSAGWTRTASLDGTVQGRDLEIDAGTIVLGGLYCQWRSYRKVAAGQWQLLGNYGPIRDCSFTAQDVDISGSRIVLANPLAGSLGPVFTSSVQVFEGVSSPSPSATITSPFPPDTSFGYAVALEGNTILATGSDPNGVHAFTGSTSTGWNYTASLVPADIYALGGATNLEMKGEFIAIAHTGDSARGLGAGSVEIQRRNSDGTFSEVARLLASDARELQNLGRHVEIDGRTIAAASADAVYFFDLPTDLSQPTRIHDNFNSGNAANWTPQAGSSFSVVTASTGRVYRQSSLAGNATSIRTNLDWRDQSIQADIRPTAFDGPDRWIGLAVRYQDAGNYYYLTARTTDTLQLKKIVNGVVTTLANVGMDVEIGRNYRIGLEAIGTRVAMFVDGRKIIDATDRSLTHGSAGPIMFKMRADYDNVVLSPSPLLPLMSDDFRAPPDRWTTLGDGEWEVVRDPSNDNNLFEQRSMAGGARAITGIKVKDLSVQVEARPLAFGAGSGRWFGIMARYVDDNNYYYVTVRNDNTLSLRKLVNGSIVVLRTLPFNLTMSQWYELRLEAIGSSLRVYVDDELKIEAADTSFREGRYGLAMFKAHMNFDNFLATQQ